jgi:hypothetical protein
MIVRSKARIVEAITNGHESARQIGEAANLAKGRTHELLQVLVDEGVVYKNRPANGGYRGYTYTLNKLPSSFSSRGNTRTPKEPDTEPAPYRHPLVTQLWNGELSL